MVNPIIEKLRAMRGKEGVELAPEVSVGARFESSQSAVDIELDGFDERICVKAGTLAAYGLSDLDLAAALLLTQEQVLDLKLTKRFKEAYSQHTMERANSLINRAEGWNAVEETGLAQVLQALQLSRDPNFALRAAVFANRAIRHTPSTVGRVIDASRAGNVVQLTLSKKFVTATKNEDGSSTVETVELTARASLPKKQSDLPNPRKISEILGIAEVRSEKQREISRIEQLAEEFGVSPEMLDDT